MDAALRLIGGRRWCAAWRSGAMCASSAWRRACWCCLTG